MIITDITDLKTLTDVAAAALLARQNVTVKHQPNWSRNGFPLPVKRMPADIFGSVTQDYRPLAILEYVNEKVNAEATGERMREYHSSEKDAPADLFGGMVFDNKAPVGDFSLMPASSLFRA